MKNDFLFSHNKRLFLSVTFDEFVAIAKSLEAIVRETHPAIHSKVVTCEDLDTYDYSTVSYLSEEVTEGLRNQHTYTLGQFTKDIWKKSLDISLVFSAAITAPNTSEPAIWLSHDKHADSGRILFRGSNVDQQTYERVISSFNQPSLSYRIGDGSPMVSEFHMLFGNILHNERVMAKRYRL